MVFRLSGKKNQLPHFVAFKRFSLDSNFGMRNKDCVKLERFLAKNQLWSNENFENWSCGELSKIEHHFRK